MKTIKEYKRELLLAGMICIQLLALFFPAILPAGLVEFALLGMLILLLLTRIQRIDLSLKRKYN